jgi:hypothetical protein
MPTLEVRDEVGAGKPRGIDQPGGGPRDERRLAGHTDRKRQLSRVGAAHVDLQLEVVSGLTVLHELVGERMRVEVLEPRPRARASARRRRTRARCLRRGSP